MRSGGWIPLFVALFLLAYPAVFFVWGYSLAPIQQRHGDQDTADQQPGKDGPSETDQTALISSVVGWFGDRDNVTMLSTVVIAFFTVVLAMVTNRQARLTRDSINLARDEFIASHRPRIIVRWIQQWDREDGFDSVNVVLVNIGESAALITSLGADLARRNRKTKDWEVPGISAGGRPLAEPIRLEGGEAYVWNARAKSKWGLSDAFGEVEMCAVGVVIYRDDNGVARETGFFRVLDTVTNRYVPSEEPEQEYRD